MIMRKVAATPVLVAVLLLAACGGDDTTATPKKDTATSTSATATATESAVSPSEEATGAPAIKPCDLLTKEIAQDALGKPVGEPTNQQGPGNSTCVYTPAGGADSSLVMLTTYESVGEEALAAAVQAFPDAKPVADLGDAAYVSAVSHSIGVSDGDLLFSMTVVTMDAAMDAAPDEVVAKLTDLARSVLETR